MDVVKDFLIDKAPMCTSLTSIENIRRLMKENEADEIFVVDTMEEGHLVGVIFDEDISAMSFKKGVIPSRLNAQECMRSVPAAALDDMTLEECQRVLDENHLNYLPVIDEEGHLCGVYERINHLREFVGGRKPKREQEEELEEEKMESEGGHDSHTVH